MESAVWILDFLMEHHEELVNADVDILMEHHEKSAFWGIVTPAEFCWAYPRICGEPVFSE